MRLRNRHLDALATIVVTTLVLSGGMVGGSAAGAATTPRVVVTPGVGYVRPGETVTVALSGFAPNEPLDVYWDTTDELLLLSDGTGTAAASFATPSTASPGAHYVTAIGRQSQRAAQGTYKIFTDWSQFAFDTKHQGHNVYENVLNSENVGRLATQWTNRLDGTAVSGSPIVVAGDVYVATAGGRIYKVDGNTGATIWKVNVGSAMEGTPAIGKNGGLLVVGDDAGDILGLNTSNGSRAWPAIHTGAAVVGSPVMQSGVAYVPSSSGVIYAVDISTGAVQWTVTTAGPIWGSPVIANGVLSVELCNSSTGAQLETVALDDTSAASAKSLVGNCENVSTPISYVWARVVGLVGNGDPGTDFCDLDDFNQLPGGAHSTLATLSTGVSCVVGSPENGVANFSDGNVAVAGGGGTLQVVDLNNGATAGSDVGSGESTPTVAAGVAFSSGAVFDQTARSLGVFSETCDGAAFPVADGHVYCASQFVDPPYEDAGLVSFTIDGRTTAAATRPSIAELRSSGTSARRGDLERRD